MNLRRNLTSLLLLLALVGAGCGESDDNADALTKEEYIEAADQICADGDAEIDEQGKEFTGEGQVDDLVQTAIVPGQRQQLQQLGELNPPEADRAEIERFLATYERAVDQLEANPEQIIGGQALATITKARRIALAYGLQSCSRGASN